MRVLVVEDDLALGTFLQKGLRMEGYEVDLVSDGDAALAEVEEHHPSLMVLDLGLLRRDGLEVLQRLSVHSEMSVLVLTGRSVEDRIACLNLGADDCLLKPFSFQELTARCRALRRRHGSGSAGTVLHHEDLEMNRVLRKVRRGDRPVDLTTKEYSLLEYLLLHRGRCISRRELLTEVWDISPETSTNVVDVYVNYLRKKLAASDGISDSLIETVRGEGYGLRFSRKQAIPAVSLAEVIQCA